MTCISGYLFQHIEGTTILASVHNDPSMLEPINDPSDDLYLRIRKKTPFDWCIYFFSTNRSW
jgi:hypothetical protein